MDDKVKIFVVGPAFHGQVSQIFSVRKDRFTLVDSPEESEVIVLTGGEDINPALYGQKALAGTYFSKHRDDVETDIINRFKDKVFIGICRGAQLLNVMLDNGGSMWQHVTGHAGTPHLVRDVLTGLNVLVNSLHHQGMIPGPRAQIVAYSEFSEHKFADGESFHRAPGGPECRDFEVLWYPCTSCLCFQAHPEFGHASTRNYFFDLVADLVIPAVVEKRKEATACAV